ncbi:MAG TPA: glycerol-3-phosphate dehydrogenase/oxidase [Verrucomicrobiales bacterium]|nr:glycerol-3-phosphate dehydrogenase/oxidase [Verrucomicrobiales bacterium]
MNRNAQLIRFADASEQWDIIVIGGGATGLGIAVDAATRGYRTALLEQADFAEGTSSKSTKLIHGGVRYLRSGEIGLVRESLRERGRLLRNAPNVVIPLPFVVPAYRWYERAFYGVGMTIYDLLAGKLGMGPTGHLSAKSVAVQIPNLLQNGLYGGTLYWDGQFDDARLAIAMARTAVANGAAVANHVQVEELVRESGRIAGVVARDQLDGRDYRLRGRVVINATGVFTDSVRRMDDPGAEAVIRPSQGIHLVLDRRFLGGETAVMIPSTEDGRVLFVIPWQNRVILGTTDTEPVPIELHPKPLAEEIDYLIRHAGRYLAEAPTHADIRATFAGLRPLVSPPKGTSGTSAQLSRSHSIFVSDSGLLTITGGKWTTYRQMAEDAVDRAAQLGGLPVQPCLTADLTLLDAVPEAGGALLDPDLPYRTGDVERAVEVEMAMTLDDVLSRRLRASFLDEAASRRCAPQVAIKIAAMLGRSEEWAAEQCAAFGGCGDCPSEIPDIPDPNGG